MLSQIQRDLKAAANPQKAKILASFFKTGRSEYGEGDMFLGVTGPKQREIAKRYIGTNFDDLQILLSSRIHEHRQTALMILVEKFRKIEERKRLFDFYLANTKNINNWDLVDCSSHKIVGEYLLDKDRSVLYRLAKSDLWEKRIAIVSTFAFIRKNDFKDTLRIAELLLDDRHDLIHKAVGWMLREVGKRDQAAEEKFLQRFYRKMPRTMLRYAIERFDEKKKAFYMSRSDYGSRNHMKK